LYFFIFETKGKEKKSGMSKQFTFFPFLNMFSRRCISTLTKPLKRRGGKSPKVRKLEPIEWTKPLPLKIELKPLNINVGDLSPKPLLQENISFIKPLAKQSAPNLYEYESKKLKNQKYTFYKENETAKRARLLMRTTDILGSPGKLRSSFNIYIQEGYDEYMEGVEKRYPGIILERASKFWSMKSEQEKQVSLLFIYLIIYLYLLGLSRKSQFIKSTTKKKN
jgi:hypothetical protein